METQDSCQRLCKRGVREDLLGYLKAEEKGERVVYGAQFAHVQPPDGGAEPLRIDDGRLLDDDARRLPIKRDRRTEARRPSARGRGCNERCREVEELVGLHNDGVPGAALLVSPHITGRGQTEDLSTDHASVGFSRCKFGHQLPDPPHLLPVALIGGHLLSFFTKR